MRRTTSQPTPVYSDDAVTAYVGDAFDLIPKLRAKHAWRHVITDPPYNAQTHKGALSTKNDGTQNHSTIVDFDAWELSTLRRLFALAAAPRWTIATVAHQHAFGMELEPPEGLRWIRMGVWVKPNHAPQLSGDRPAQGWEAVAIMHGEERCKWNGGGHAATWTLPGVARSIYPTEKPEALITSFLLRFTDPGDVILDPCCGSGPVARVAKDLDRRAVIIDKSERAVELAIRRVRQEVLL